MNYLFPFVKFLTSLLDLYSFCLMAWVVLSLLIHFDIVNKRHSFVSKAEKFLEALYSPVLRHLRRIIPKISGVDISPVILYFLILLVKALLFMLAF